MADLAGIYGAETTIEQIRLKLRCAVCGGRDKGVLADVVIHKPGHAAGGYKAPDGEAGGRDALRGHRPFSQPVN